MLHLHIHPENPQARLITQAVERIRCGLPNGRSVCNWLSNRK